MKIPYMHIELEITLNEPLFPHFPEAMFRGAFGYYLKKLTCINKKTACDQCFIRKSCPFGVLFDSNFNKSLNFKNIKTFPHPYIFYVDTIQNENTCIKLRLILFSNAFQYINHIVFAFMKMGEEGISKKRITYTIHKIIDVEEKTVLYSKSNNELSTAPIHFYEYSQKPDYNDSRQKLHLTILTPLRLKTKNGYESSISFEQLIKSTLIRLSLLADVYGEYSPDSLDINSILNIANKVELIRENLLLKKQFRYSSHKNKKLNMSGFTGYIKYEGLIAPFIPILHGGTLFGIGKNTTFGCGRYEYAIYH